MNDNYKINYINLINKCLNAFKNIKTKMRKLIRKIEYKKHLIRLFLQKITLNMLILKNKITKTI